MGKPRKNRKSGASPAQLEAARKNGAKGGRPRVKVDAGVIAKLGEPPADPLALPGYFMRAVAAESWLLINGKGNERRLQQVRASLRAAVAGVPRERLFQAERVVLSHQKREDDEVDDPPTERVGDTGRQSLRGNAPRGR